MFPCNFQMSRTDTHTQTPNHLIHNGLASPMAKWIPFFLIVQTGHASNDLQNRSYVSVNHPLNSLCHTHEHRHVNKTSKQQKQQYKVKKMDSFNLSIIVWLTRVPKHGVCTHKCSTELCYEMNQFFFLVKFRLNQFRKVTFQSDPNKVSIKWMTMSFFSASDLVASIRSSRKIEEDMHDIKITIFVVMFSFFLCVANERMNHFGLQDFSHT